MPLLFTVICVVSCCASLAYGLEAVSRFHEWAFRKAKTTEGHYFNRDLLLTSVAMLLLMGAISLGSGIMVFEMSRDYLVGAATGIHLK